MNLDSATAAKIREHEARRREEREPRADPYVVNVVSVVWPDLNSSAFYGLAGDFVRMVEPHSEADPAALLVQYLVAAGCAIGRDPHTVVEADRHAVNLYVVLVGDTTAGKKGTSWGHVRRVVTEVEPDFRIRGGLSSGEGLAYEVRDPIYQQKQNPKTGLVEEILVDEGISDKRLLVYEAEFSSVLKVATRQGNTLTAMLRDAWDGYTLSPMTKNSRICAADPHISILGHISRDELLRNITETDAASGFGNRFLWACSKRSKLLPRGGAVPEAERRDHTARLRDALTTARGIGKVERTEEAWKEWERIYEPLTMGRGGLLGAMIARGAPQVLRLSTLYALLDGSREIRPEHQRAALAVWQYCEQSATWVFGDRLGDPVADTILAAIRRSGTAGMSRTEIRDLFGRNRTKEEIDRAVDTLHSAGLASRFSEETGGRPREMWRAMS